MTENSRRKVIVRSDRDAFEHQGQQLFDLGDLVIRDASECVGELGLGIDGVEFGGFDQGVGDGGGLATGLGPDEEIIFSP